MKCPRKLFFFFLVSTVLSFTLLREFLSEYSRVMQVSHLRILTPPVQSHKYSLTWFFEIALSPSLNSHTNEQTRSTFLVNF